MGNNTIKCLCAVQSLPPFLVSYTPFISKVGWIIFSFPYPLKLFYSFVVHLDYFVTFFIQSWNLQTLNEFLKICIR